MRSKILLFYFKIPDNRLFYFRHHREGRRKIKQLTNPIIPLQKETKLFFFLFKKGT